MTVINGAPTGNLAWHGVVRIEIIYAEDETFLEEVNFPPPVHAHFMSHVLLVFSDPVTLTNFWPLATENRRPGLISVSITAGDKSRPFSNRRLNTTVLLNVIRTRGPM